jgi:hypothetical protein
MFWTEALLNSGTYTTRKLVVWTPFSGQIHGQIKSEKTGNALRAMCNPAIPARRSVQFTAGSIIYHR